MRITGVTKEGIAMRPSAENGLFVIQAGVMPICGVRGLLLGVAEEDLADIWEGHLETAHKYIQADAQVLGRYALLGEDTRFQLILSEHSHPLYSSGSFMEYGLAASGSLSV